MTNEKGLGKFFVYCVLVLALFLVMLPIIFSFSGKLIKLEVLVMLFLMLLSLISFLGYRTRWGERVLFFVFWISMGNLVFIWYFTSKLFILPLFLGLWGFLMALPKKEEECFEEMLECVEPYSEVLEEPKVEHSPGKYVASSMGSVYHEPKCNWAKKIAKNRQVWFKDKKEAQGKKYKAHKCVN